MAVNMLNHDFGSIKAHIRRSDSNRCTRLQTISGRISSEHIGISRELYTSLKFGSIRASTPHSPVDAVDLPLSNKSGDSGIGSNEKSLILMRHGESMWNEKNLFTGCVDIPLTEKGVEEAIEGGRRISSIPIDVIHTSSLIRAKMTVAIAMTQHRCEKVPIFLHNETEDLRSWSEIYSEEVREQSVSVITAWQLNERMYGDLQGLNKQETAEKFGKEVVHAWRRTYPVCPPNGESLEMCAQRAVSYFREHIEPQLLSGKNVLVVAHANSLRSIIMYLDKLTAEEVINLELSTGIPMLYILNDGKFMRRGSLGGSSESGVYAYSQSLALYRQKLDEVRD